MNKPIKRHKALQSISHDHHHGLVLAQLSKKNSPENPKLPKTLGAKIEFAIAFFYDELVPHFRKEENILFPLVKGRNEVVDELINTVLDEHKQIKSLVSLLDEMSNEDVLDEFGYLLESHIRKEERELFKMIEEVLSEEELNSIGETLTGNDII
ncbi:hemerythrin domain-containing protein [Bacteroidota bacterium]